MFNHFFMGAINKTTNKYEYPIIANKINKYKCPSCEKDIIFRNGKIKQPHFAHYKSINPCSYYEKPNEHQIHKDSKLLMKTLLDDKRCINIYRKCSYCYKNQEIILNIKSEEYTDNVCAKIEYKFNYNNSQKSADVALLQNDKLKYIFEICYTNKTKEENRPEPGVEIKAENLINETNTGTNINEKGEIKIECIRDYKCVCCKNKEENERIKRENDEIERENNERIKREKNEIERENDKIKRIQIEKEEVEMEKEENERIKRENEYRKIKRIRKEKEEKQNLLNYCKCLKPIFAKINSNIIVCNNCNKRTCNNCNNKKCKCTNITFYFNKK